LGTELWFKATFGVFAAVQIAVAIVMKWRPVPTVELTDGELVFRVLIGVFRVPYREVVSVARFEAGGKFSRRKYGGVEVTLNDGVRDYEIDELQADAFIADLSARLERYRARERPSQ
jgi:hypothetical protein